MATSEKELMEMMVSGETEHDEVVQAIDEFEAEIDRMIKEITEISPQEKLIMEKVLKALDEHKLKYSYDEDTPKHVNLSFSMEDKPFEIEVILQHGKVILKLTFPFKVRTNAIALMGIYMTEFNSAGTAFSPLSVEFDKGKVYMDYAYMLEEPDQFDEKNFWIYMTSHIKFALEIYIRLENICVGLIPKKDRRLYKKLLEMALETVNGDFDDENVSYGIKSLKSEDHHALSHLFDNENDDSDNDDSDSDDKDITSDIIQSMRSRRRILPRFEEFMCMKGQVEGSSEEEETEDQPKKASGMLSMFAKRDDENDPKVVGGNEDE